LRHGFDREPEAATLALIERVRDDRSQTALDGTTHAAAEWRPPARPDSGATGVAASSKRPKNLARAAEWSLLAVLGVAGLLLLTSDWGAPNGGAKPPVSESSWRPPALYAGGGVIDRSALEAQGRYAMIVLPFAVADGASSQDRAAADQISDDLIDDLSRVPALRVISRSTSRLYRQDALDVAALGAELGVRYVVEGRVASEGSTLRVDVALSDATTRLLVWSERFERGRAEQSVLQDDISLAIARALQLTVIGSEDSRHRVGTTGDPQVAALLAKGWAAMLHIGTSGTGSGADADFAVVLEREPENVSALIGSGAYDVSVVAMFLVPDREQHLARAEEALHHAIRNDPDASLAYYFLGILQKVRGAPHDALSDFSKAIELDPSLAPAYAQLGHVLSRLDRQDDAMEHIRYAIRLSPRDPNLGLWSLFGGEIELERGHDEAAVEWLRRAATLDPTSPFMHAALAATLALMGDEAGSAREAAEVRRLAPWLTQEQMRERLIGLSENGSEPERLLHGLQLAFAQPKPQ
jgi:TolB-like protein